MSLVEKALEKMQQAQRIRSTTEAPAPRQTVFGTIVGGEAVISPDGAQPPERPPARIVAIDQLALREAGILPPQPQERQIAHQYRQIKRPLVSNALGRGTSRLPNGHLIMIASAMPGEGKTFTSVNLAFSMTLEKDLRVVLVDADIPKPHITRLFGLDAERGLTDVLSDRSLDVESLVLPTDVPGLFVLPAGTRTENATELLASNRMRDLVTQLARNDSNRIALFDSPPLLLTTESHALSDLAGQIVVVVRAETTPQSVVLDGLSFIPQGKPVSLVLNQCTDRMPSGYYYYGYSESRGNAPRT
jgi:protein-tyrosine kinase